MSYTTAPRVSVARASRGGMGLGAAGTRGRGRTAAGRGAAAARPEDLQHQQEDSDQRDNPKVQRRDGFTMFAPDQKKRDQIAKQAQGEEEKYKKYKDSQKLGHVSYVGTAGGGLSQEGACRQKIQQNRVSPIKQKATFQQQRNQERERERNELDRKKAVARGKAIQNEMKDSERQARLDEDRRRKNEEFLKRFEKGSKS